MDGFRKEYVDMETPCTSTRVVPEFLCLNNIQSLQRNPPVSPTVHIFASPPTEAELSPPHVLLLPLQSNASAEPALLLVSPTGVFRFWSSIFLGLSGADRFVEERIPLSEPKPPRDKETITIAQVLIPSLSLASSNASLRSTFCKSEEARKCSQTYRHR